MAKLRCFFLWTRQHYGKRRGIFLDAGANIGTTVIPATFSPWVNGGLAVEPSPFNFQCLEEGVKASNRPQPIDCVQAALGDIDKAEVDLALSPANCGDNRVAAGPNEKLGWETVRVPLRTIDSIWEEKNYADRPAFIWIDAQGAEAEIIAGTEFRADPRVPFFIEFFPPGLINPEGFFHLMESHWSAFIEFHSKKIVSIGKLRVMYDRMMQKKNPGIHTDLFLIR